MKKQLLVGAFLLGSLFTANAQDVLFQDSFEDYTNFAIANVGQWTLTDVDASPTYGFSAVEFANMGEAFSYIVFNSTATTPPLTAAEGSDYTARTGSKAMASFAAIPAPNGAAPNNDWLISPRVQLAQTGNVLRFWAKSADGLYLETFKVGVSTTTTDTSAFTVISGSSAVQAPALTWTQFEYNLDAYAGQNVYLSINCVSNDKFVFMVDDFVVTSNDTAGLNDALSTKFSVYPNPANNVINITNSANSLVNSVTIVDLNGRTVKADKFDGVANAQINISDLSSGMYLMNITTDKGTATKKIVKN